LHFGQAEEAFRSLWNDGDVTDLWHRGAVAIRVAMIDLIRGRLDDARGWLGEGIDIAQHARNWSELSLAHGLLTMHAACRGDLDGAVRAARDSFTCYERSSYRYSIDVVYPALISAYAVAGEWAAVTENSARYQAVAGRRRYLPRLYVATMAGDDAELRGVLAERALRLPGDGQLDLQSVALPVVTGLAAVRLADPELLERVCPPLRELVALEVVHPLGWPIDAAHLLGRVEALLTTPDVTESSWIPR
jgi:hypothetical protein